MKRKTIKISTIVIGLVLTLSGCASKLKTENSNLSDELSELKQKNTELTQQVDALKKNEEELKNKLNSLTQAPKEEIELTVFSVNDLTLNKEAAAKVTMDKNLPLKDKLSLVAKKLSEKVFGNLPIEVVSIENVGNKKVATINLKESAQNQGVKDNSKLKGENWAASRFQGSTGGAVTAKSLTETFLQKDYKGEWIDGVRFYYENKPIQFQHVEGLSEIIYR